MSPLPPPTLPPAADSPRGSCRVWSVWPGAAASPGPSVEEVPVVEPESGLDQPWHVVVSNDPVNLMSYVTLVIRRIFGYSQEKAAEMMLQVHQKGQCIVWTGAREQAELYVKQLQEHQLLSSMKKAG